MAVTQTGAMYKSLTFDNKASREYGVYITGEAVYNAPERAVEMISIPGRNGSFALDQGRFENIEVTYPAGIFAENEADFAQAISDFRNFLCSKKGYCRLTDEYNPSEYRMAVYKSGLEVDPAQLRAGEFEITFDCKPQRWLTSGETKQTIANSGDTITNPTLFDANPMIETEGYGTLIVNGHQIELENEVIGNVEVLKGKRSETSDPSATTLTNSWTFNRDLCATGDTLSLDSISQTVSGTTYWGSMFGSAFFTLNRDYIIGAKSSTTTNLAKGYSAEFVAQNGLQLAGVLPSATFVIGTASSISGSYHVDVATRDSNYTTVETAEFTISFTLSYDGDNVISISVGSSIDADPLGLWAHNVSSSGTNIYASVSKAMCDSTVTLLGTPTYIDCDLGICYKIENGTIIDLNRYIDLGSELPYLAPGTNTITFDNTFTKVDIVPRWWKI